MINGEDEDGRPMSSIEVDQPRMTATVRHLSSTLFSSFSSSRFNLSGISGSLNNSQGAGDILIGATLVEPIEVVADVATMGFCQRHGKIIGSLSFIVLVGFVTLVVTTYKTIGMWGNTLQPTAAPSSMPSMAPSFDPRPTLQIVQDRGVLRCGLQEFQTKGSFRYQLCQAIAAVVLNNPDAVEKVNRTAQNRFIMLNDRVVDILAGGDTYTIEREVNEPTTGDPFTFSTPYYYDGLVYAGNQTFISCAEEIKRYDECSQLAICVTNGTTDYEYIANHFSSDFLVMSESPRESISLYNDGKCNVIAHGRLGLINFMFREGDLMHPSFAIGNKTFNNDPLAFVTRPDDYEWSNVVNYALQALFYGERHGIGKNEEMCDNRTDDLSSNWNELHYLNAVYCVGNYTEIYSNSQFADFTRTAINTINEGTPMLYVIPYGNLDNTHNEMFFDLSATFARIKRQTNVNCGILVQESHNGNSTFEGSFGMATDYCQTLASSMLDGNNFAVNYTTFYNEERSITALKNEEVDVLFGLAAEMTHNFDEVAFSTPYYYGNQTGKYDVSFYPIMTRQGDKAFSSFVNCIVLSTFYAASEGIDRNNSFAMPTMTIFGSDMLWALKDAISANGNYDEIYFSNFGNATEVEIGRNTLNHEQGPQFLDMPGSQFQASGIFS